jgi:putative transposase
MPSSYTSLYYHIVFSTKHRKPLLVDSIRTGLYKYIAGIIENKEGRLIEIGGVEDHIHILATCSPKRALADFIRDIKANASRWVNEQPRSMKFAWQNGYGAFTVSVSQVEVVRRYIRNQAEHHRRQSFVDEFRTVLIRHGISFDEQQLFEDEFHG